MRATIRLCKFLIPYSKWILLSTSLSFAAVAAGIGLLGTSALIIAQAALKPPFSALQLGIVGVRFFGISRGVFRYLERLSSHSINLKFLADIRLWFYYVLEQLLPSQQINFQKGDLFARITADIDTLEDLYIRIISPPITAILITVFVALFMGRINPQLTPIILMGMMMGGLLMFFVAASVTEKSGAKMIKLRGEFSRMLKDLLDGNEDVHTSGTWQKKINEFSIVNDGYYSLEKDSALQRGTTTFLSIFIPGATLLGILWLGLELVDNHQIDGITLAVLTLVTIACFEAIIPLGSAGEVLSKINQSAERLMLLNSTNHVIIDAGNLVPTEFTGEIKVENLSFHYPGEINCVLNSIDFSLVPGKLTALVGPTGSGKSTIVNLLLRFWDINEWGISLDGIEIHKYQLADVRNQFSVMSNSSYIFANTLSANLSIANPSANLDEINSALKLVNMYHWAMSLPDQLNTWIGENGWQISAGQRQRILLARMLLRNSPVMIFDEPTANMDAISENRLWSDIKPVLKNYSVLWITHRLVHMDDMDEILFLSKGSIIERGIHKDLIEKEGAYFQMWNIQNKLLIYHGESED